MQRGDPLERDPYLVLEDVTDEYELDRAATEAARAEIRANRAAWLAEDSGDVARRFREGELDMFDLIRRYGVIVDWGTGELFESTTERFRELIHRRSAQHWHS